MQKQTSSASPQRSNLVALLEAQIDYAESELRRLNHFYRPGARRTYRRRLLDHIQQLEAKLAVAK